MASKIDPKQIRIDCDTQSRVEINENVIADYAEAMEQGDEFPPILVFYDDVNHEFILVDGFHRYYAHMRARPNDPILADQQLGTVDDARWASLAANKSHGLHRSNADKQNAVRLALLHPKGCEMSDRQIGKHVGVDNKTVANIRYKLESTEELPQSDLRTGQDGRKINTEKIGKKQSPPEDATCKHCLNYTENDRCVLDDEIRTPWTAACDEFRAIPPEPERPVVPDPPEVIERVDPPSQVAPKRNPQQYKPRNTLRVDVPLGNPQLAAAEMRTMLGEEYLKECFIAVRVLLSVRHDDDPFPNLKG